MIKIKASFNTKTNEFDWKYSVKHTNSMEHIATIWNLIDKILENDEYVNEADLIKLIKNRKKYMTEMEEK